MGRDEMIEAIGRIATAVEIPVSADIEPASGRHRSRRGRRWPR